MFPFGSVADLIVCVYFRYSSPPSPSCSVRLPRVSPFGVPWRMRTRSATWGDLGFIFREGCAMEMPKKKTRELHVLSIL